MTSNRQRKRVELFDELNTTFERIEASLSILRSEWVAAADTDEELDQSEQCFNSNPIVVNTVWRLCCDITRAVNGFANTQSSMKNDTTFMTEINKRLDETSELVKSNWLDMMSFGENLSLSVTASSMERVAPFAEKYTPPEPVHDQPRNLRDSGWNAIKERQPTFTNGAGIITIFER